MIYTIQEHEKDHGDIIIECPKCHHKQPLILDGAKEYYDIDNDGVIFPDFVCMREDRSCMFMKTIKLEGWRGIY